jgi:glyoxylase-like metal-dependent hydrolase (beta-lactamase superfamily II)
MINDCSDAAVQLLQLQLGGDRNFQYLLATPAGEAAAIDPGFEPRRIAEIAAGRRLHIELILITHGHSDHAGGAPRLAELTGAPVRAGGAAVAGVDPLRDGERLPLGNLHIEAWYTPGHAADHFCFLCRDHLFSGDLLFCGKVGGTGAFFPGSSAQAEWTSLPRLVGAGRVDIPAPAARATRCDAGLSRPRLLRRRG